MSKVYIVYQSDNYYDDEDDRINIIAYLDESQAMAEVSRLKRVSNDKHDYYYEVIDLVK